MPGNDVRPPFQPMQTSALRRSPAASPNSSADQASGAAAASQSIIDVSKSSKRVKSRKAVTSDSNRSREADVVNAKERTVQV